MSLSTYVTVGFRVLVAGLFIAHGLMRISNGTVDNFGEFLETKGFPLGFVLAWLITLYEIIAGTLLLAGRWTRIVALGFVVHQVMGILLVHAKNGWFVVGPGVGGMEYSVLLIGSCLLIAAGRANQK
jgi:putative oxidoreductase